MMEVYGWPRGAVNNHEFEDMRRRRLRRHKAKLQVIDDPAHGPELRDESDDLLRLLVSRVLAPSVTDFENGFDRHCR